MVNVYPQLADRQVFLCSWGSVYTGTLNSDPKKKKKNAESFHLIYIVGRV